MTATRIRGTSRVGGVSTSRRLATVLLGLLLVAGMLVAGSTPPASGGQERAGPAAARASFRQARAAGDAAEGRVKEAEGRLVEVGLEWSEAATRQRRLARRLDALRRRQAGAEAERDRERLALRAQAVETYKLGGQQNAAALELFRTATEGAGLARDLHLMGIVVDRQAGRYRRAQSEVEALQAEQDRTIRRWREAVDAAWVASREIPALEDEVVQAREAADDVEARTVEALGRLRAATRSAEGRGRAAPGESPAARGRAGGAGPDGGDGSAGGSRSRALTGRMVAARRAALAASRALPPEARRLRKGLACLTRDPTFTNDYHFPRDHHRRHKGTDVFADRGSRAVAPTRARVVKIDRVDNYPASRDLGGITVSLRTPEGDRWYLAHLQRVARGVKVGDRVEAGQTVGRVGSSGNAKGTPPHIHVGLYVGNTPVNPFPSLAVACRGPQPQRGTALPWLGQLVAPIRLW